MSLSLIFCMCRHFCAATHHVFHCFYMCHMSPLTSRASSICSHVFRGAGLSSRCSHIPLLRQCWPCRLGAGPTGPALHPPLLEGVLALLQSEFFCLAVCPRAVFLGTVFFSGDSRLPAWPRALFLGASPSSSAWPCAPVLFFLAPVGPPLPLFHLLIKPPPAKPWSLSHKG